MASKSLAELNAQYRTAEKALCAAEDKQDAVRPPYPPPSSADLTVEGIEKIEAEHLRDPAYASAVAEVERLAKAREAILENIVAYPARSVQDWAIKARVAIDGPDWTRDKILENLAEHDELLTA